CRAIPTNSRGSAATSTSLRETSGSGKARSAIPRHLRSPRSGGLPPQESASSSICSTRTTRAANAPSAGSASRPPPPASGSVPSAVIGTSTATTRGRPFGMARRVLAACSLGGAGHLQPLLPLLEAARAHGDQTLIVGPPAIAEMVAGTGHPFAAGGEPPEAAV